MREAVIVSYARTGLAKSGRGGFNITPPMSHGGPRHQARRRARPASRRTPSKTASWAMCAHGAPNIGRQAALLAGLPITTAGVTINRFCSSGLQSIAMAAHYDQRRRRRLHRGRRRRDHLDSRRRLRRENRTIRELIEGLRPTSTWR